MISHDLLLAKLAANGVSPPSLVLVHSYLRDRSQRVRIEEVYPRDRFEGPSFFIFFLTICSLTLIVLICPTTLMITKFF